MFPPFAAPTSLLADFNSFPTEVASGLPSFGFTPTSDVAGNTSPVGTLCRISAESLDGSTVGSGRDATSGKRSKNTLPKPIPVLRKKCTHCDETFADIRNMKRHLKASCSGNGSVKKRFSCMFCDEHREFSRKDPLVRHIRQKHTPEELELYQIHCWTKKKSDSTGQLSSPNSSASGSASSSSSSSSSPSSSSVGLPTPTSSPDPSSPPTFDPFLTWLDPTGSSVSGATTIESAPASLQVLGLSNFTDPALWYW